MSLLKLKMANRQIASMRPVKQVSTLQKINQYLTIECNKPPNYERQPSHSPSNLGSKCLRKIYYNYWRLDRDVPLTHREARIFALGHHVEDMIMVWLRGIGEHIPYRNKGNGEIPLDRDGSGKQNPQFPISSEEFKIKKGFIDNIGIDTEGKLWIYEIKSCKAEKFESLQEPYPEHKVQAGLYYIIWNQMRAAGEFDHIKEIPPTVTSAAGVKYLYFNKDTSEMKEFVITPDILKSYIENITERLQKINGFVDTKTLPPTTQDYCSYCAYQKKCKDDYNIS